MKMSLARSAAACAACASSAAGYALAAADALEAPNRSSSCPARLATVGVCGFMATAMPSSDEFQPASNGTLACRPAA